MVSQQPLERFTGVWASSIGVMQDALRLATQPDGQHECIGDQLRGHGRMPGPADDLSREEIHHCRDVEPAFGGPEIGEVSDPFAIGRRGCERSVEHIQCDSVC